MDNGSLEEGVQTHCHLAGHSHFEPKRYVLSVDDVFERACAEVHHEADIRVRAEDIKSSEDVRVVGEVHCMEDDLLLELLLHVGVLVISLDHLEGV